MRSFLPWGMETLLGSYRPIGRDSDIATSGLSIRRLTEIKGKLQQSRCERSKLRDVKSLLFSVPSKARSQVGNNT